MRKAARLTLAEISRKKSVLKNRVAQEIEGAIVTLAAFGQVRVANVPTRVYHRGMRCLEAATGTASGQEQATKSVARKRRTAPVSQS
jgi:hypothetical protein